MIFPIPKIKIKRCEHPFLSLNIYCIFTQKKRPKKKDITSGHIIHYVEASQNHTINHTFQTEGWTKSIFMGNDLGGCTLKLSLYFPNIFTWWICILWSLWNIIHIESKRATTRYLIWTISMKSYPPVCQRKRGCWMREKKESIKIVVTRRWYVPFDLSEDFSLVSGAMSV